MDALAASPLRATSKNPHYPMKTALRQSGSRDSFHSVRQVVVTGLLLFPVLLLADPTEISIGELTTISSTVHNGFQREKLPDGSLKPIKYAFGEGTSDPGRIADKSFARLNFGQLAGLISAPLAKLGYQPCTEVNQIDQLIVVHWGRTVGWDSSGYGDGYGTLNNTYSAISRTFPNAGSLRGNFGPGQSSPPTRGLGGEPGAASEMDHMTFMLSVQEDARNRANARNALLLGYYDTLRQTPTFFGDLVSPRRERLIQDLEDDRYYVIVIAYDFQSTRKSRQPKVLWITRFSLQARGNDFDRSIYRMVHAASAYFGRSSDGLRYERLPEGKAVPGELKFLEYMERTK